MVIKKLAIVLFALLLIAPFAPCGRSEKADLEHNREVEHFKNDILPTDGSVIRYAN